MAALGLGTAGCLGFGGDPGEQSGDGRPATVQNAPDAVYVPTHVEGMKMEGMGRDGRYRFALSYSFPHRFWLVTGTRRRTVDLCETDSMHLMVSAWDGETGTVLPASNATVQVSQSGESVVEKSLWAMLSQNMGVHFGDNVALPGEGSYDVSLSFGPPEARALGAFAGAFDAPGSANFELSFSQEALDGLTYRDLSDRQGERGAASPMEMEMQPTGQLPAAGDLPGRALGHGETGDAVLAAVALEELPAGIDGDGTYLAVSTRTPYNRYPLPVMSLSAPLSRSGDAAFDGPLPAGLHPDLGYHYGAVVEEVATGDELEIRVDAPPQVARHEGYETAFLEMDRVTLSV